MSAKTNQGSTLIGSGPGTRGNTKWPETKFSTATEAQIFLIEKNLLDNENITILALANALRLLATRTSPQNGLKEGILYEETLPALMDQHITNTIDSKLHEILDKFWSLQDQLETASAEITHIPEKMENTTTSLADIASEAAARVEAAAQSIKTDLETHSTSTTPRQATMSYAAIAANIPTTTISKAELNSRRIILDKCPNMTENSLSKLSERELVEKCTQAVNILLTSDEAQTETPDNIEVSSAVKLRNGGVIIEFTTAAATQFVKDNAKSFEAAMGGTSVIKSQLWLALAENVPIDHDPDSEPERNNIEERSDLPHNAIASTKWIKQIARREPNQANAHLIVSFNNQEAFNLALEKGLIISYKRVLVRRLEKQPKRCFNCQTFTTKHIAADCPDAQTCATCGKPHRTNECTVTDPKGFFCNNCNVTGHAAWARNCPAYLEADAALKKRHNHTHASRQNQRRPAAVTQQTNSDRFEMTAEEKQLREADITRDTLARRAAYKRHAQGAKTNFIGRADKGWGEKEQQADLPAPAKIRVDPERNSRLSPFLAPRKTPLITKTLPEKITVEGVNFVRSSESPEL